MIPVLLGAAAVLTVAALSDDDDNDKGNQWHDETTTHQIPESELPPEIRKKLIDQRHDMEIINDEETSRRIVSDEYVREKMKKLGRSIRRD